MKKEYNLSDISKHKILNTAMPLLLDTINLWARVKLHVHKPLYALHAYYWLGLEKKFHAYNSFNYFSYITNMHFLHCWFDQVSNLQKRFKLLLSLL